MDKIKKTFNEWYVRALNFFGPPNRKSEPVLKAYGKKRQSNEELRNQYQKDLNELLSELQLKNLVSDRLSNEYPYVLS